MEPQGVLTALHVLALHVLGAAMIVVRAVLPVLNQLLVAREQGQKLVTSGQEALKKTPVHLMPEPLLHVLLTSLHVRLEPAAARLETAAARLVVIHGLTSLLLVPTTTPAMEARLSRMLRTASLGLVTCI
jgi:hypothetical protein